MNSELRQRAQVLATTTEVDIDVKSKCVCGSQSVVWVQVNETETHNGQVICFRCGGLVKDWGEKRR